MMNNFEYAVNKLLLNEGGYIKHPADPGGATNYGISLRFLKSLPKYEDATDSTIRNLSKNDAIEIYRECWWDSYRYGEIKSQQVAFKIFDMAVNMGAKQAHMLLQRAIRAVNGEILVDDGILGEKTMEQLDRICNTILEPCLIAAFKSECASFYRHLNRPDFIKGWLRRAYS